MARQNLVIILQISAPAFLCMDFVYRFFLLTLYIGKINL